MENINVTPEELLQSVDPTPELPEPIVIPRDTWRQLIQTAHAESSSHVWIWAVDGIYRISKLWLGHPAIADHWQLVIEFGGDPA